jgi:hypothetical protein
MLEGVDVAVYSEINTKHINTVWVQRTILEYSTIVIHVTNRLKRLITTFV